MRFSDARDRGSPSKFPVGPASRWVLGVLGRTLGAAGQWQVCRNTRQVTDLTVMDEAGADGGAGDKRVHRNHDRKSRSRCQAACGLLPANHTAERLWSVLTPMGIFFLGPKVSKSQNFYQGIFPFCRQKMGPEDDGPCLA